VFLFLLVLYMIAVKQTHSFHLVDPSPWPVLGAFSAMITVFGTVLKFHGYFSGSFLYLLGFISLLFVASFWWGNIVREGTIEGQHTAKVKKGLMLGMILFIVSEVMFFFAFFFAFFYLSLNPSHVLGGVWPPFLYETLNAFDVPFLNTVILLTSGATITVAHEAIIAGSKSHAVTALLATISLAVLFTALQALEYVTAPFCISDSVYGSIFYMATGFHGFHVFIGTVFITVCLIRLYFNHFTSEHHCGFEAAAWYWHFVDVVWLFLFISIYWWGS
jgi:cytochrome c oxidase subunit 3